MSAKQKLLELKVNEISLVDEPANQVHFLVVKSLDPEFHKAVWPAAFINDLPDSAFLHISPGGEKDADGKTVPRSLRHFPIRGADGKIDLPHLMNALSRIPQSNVPETVKERITDEARRLLEQGTKTKTEKGKTMIENQTESTAVVEVKEQQNVDKAAKAAMPDDEMNAHLMAFMNMLHEYFSKPPMEEEKKKSDPEPNESVAKGGKQFSKLRVAQLKDAMCKMLELVKEVDEQTFKDLVGSFQTTQQKSADDEFAKKMDGVLDQLAGKLDGVAKRMDQLEKAGAVSKALAQDQNDKPHQKEKSFWSGVL